MPVDHRHLAEHARRRHEQTLQRAQQALAEMADAGQVVTIALLAKQTRISRSWIYTQTELVNQIRQLQQNRAAAGFIRESITRASDDSLRQRLALAHNRITQLRAENQQLRDALAHAHGQLRTVRLHTVER
jgi:hypothetical protein